MNFQVRYTRSAREDLKRLVSFLAERDLAAAKRARKAISKSMELLANFPWSCRKASQDNPFVRELDRKSTRLNSSHTDISRMPSSA